MNFGEQQKRIADLLHFKIRQAGRSMRDVSRELGWRPDQVSRLLKGTFRLELDHIYAILFALSLPPSQFWAEVHGDQPGPESAASGESSVFAELPEVPAPDPGLVLPGGFTVQQLEALMRQVVREELNKTGPSETAARAAKRAAVAARQEAKRKPTAHRRSGGDKAR